jgi:CMP-N,N'-diacetyllegionaminic acid synthase
MMRTLGLVPARGGSKGVPRKNVRPLCGKPLLEYTAEAALGARRLSRVVLSTDDPVIADVGRRCGLEVPFLRPAELARDDSPTLPVVQHALDFFARRHETFDAVCILQPTTPLRPPEYIDECIELLEESGADAVVTIVPVPPEHNPHWVYFRREDGRIELSTGEATPIPRRQDLPPAFRREGSVYVTRTEVVTRAGSLFGEQVLGYPVDPSQSVDINTPFDWTAAEQMLDARIR